MRTNKKVRKRPPKGLSRFVVHITNKAWACALTGHCRKRIEAAAYLEYVDEEAGVMAKAMQRWCQEHGITGELIV